MLDERFQTNGVAEDTVDEMIDIETNGDYQHIVEAIPVDESDVENSGSSDVEVFDTNSNEVYEQGHVPIATPPIRTGIASFPLADEYEKLANRLMKPIPDYPTKDSAHFVWEIKDWSSARKENKLSSPPFECGGYKWSILLFPRGNSDVVSLYMEPHPPVDEDGTTNPDWYICAQFALDMWNPLHPESHYPSGSSHSLIRFWRINQVNITGFVRVVDDSSTGVLWSNFVNYDSKSSTGYVGLNNQGATCYLNSLLQSYFTTRSFRNLVCQIPTHEQVSSDSSNKNSKAVALALQRIFYLMQSSDQPVGTMELTKSFGWDSSEAFTQHDVQELNRVLMDKLESAMKGSDIENKLNDIFVGKMKSYIKCVNVPYESSRVEDFWDIQLNVKGFRNVQESFKNYIEIEMLDGENKYQAGEEYGYQDAKKGVVFESFPPVLHLQLKRFEYDFTVDDLVKIDDFYEFPDNIDLRPYLDEELDESVKNQNWNYKLHGVLVHQGSISNGHYYAMIKPESSSSTWMRFDDDRVWKVTPTQVFKENFGAADLTQQHLRSLSRMEQNEYLIRKATSAYMLVYYRENDLTSILPNTLATVPEHVSGQIEKEREEMARLERAKREALYYLHVKIVTADNFTFFNGFDICPDPTKIKEYDPEIFDARAYPITIKVRKDAKFSTVYKLVAEKLGYAEAVEDDAEENIICDEDLEKSQIEDEDFDVSSCPFSLMIMKQRNNKTNRPDVVVPEEYLSESVNQVYNKCFRRKYDELAFFVKETRKELHHISTQDAVTVPELFNFDAVSEKLVNNTLGLTQTQVENPMTIFLKYFDPVSDTVRGLTFATVSKNLVISQLKTDINKFLGFDATTPLEFYEEISRLKVEPIDASLTLEKSELGTGDILAVQVGEVTSFSSEHRLGNVQNYFKFLLTRLHLQVKPCKVNEDEEDSDFVAEEDISREDNGLNADSSEAKELKLAKEMSKSFDLWVSTTYSYQELAASIARKIGEKVDPNYLRLFVVNNHGVRIPLSSNVSLSQIFTRQVAVSSISQFEYEILNITLKEYENMKAIKIHWLESIYQDHLFDLLVPKTSTVSALIQKLVQKVDLPREKLSGLLVWAGQDNKYVDLIKFDRSIDELNDEVEIYCGYFPAEVEILVSHDMFKRYTEPDTPDGSDIADPVIRSEFQKAQKHSKSLNIIPVFHFHKSTTYTHSKPFVFAIFPEEPFEETKERLRKKLGLGVPAFDKIRIALADLNDKGRYLDTEKEGFSLLDEISKFESHVSLALDHRDRNPKRSNPLDKGISIG
ncbi:hypothetical protein JCM33374_g999 [Metschnikowia sp. JCM 33374]|nr:hypothetical protein JCM33374_g999 [Metschnikowia sp. JCM 33374]